MVYNVESRHFLCNLLHAGVKYSMCNTPTRKKMRLEGYDYSRAGCYFITICVKNRQELLGRIVGDGVLDVPYCDLSETGKLVDSQMRDMSYLYEDKWIEKYVIMPNHVHMMVVVERKDGSPRVLDGTSRTPSPTTNAAIPSFVSTLKRYINKNCGVGLWQRSYHDHIIRNEAEYQKIWQYIEENPARWKEDCYFAANA